MSSGHWPTFDEQLALNIEALGHANQRLREQPLWMLLAATNGPVVLAILETHLLDKDRTLPVSVLEERLHEDLRRLRIAGFDLDQGADKLVSQWIKSGYLVRRLAAGATEEELELSVGAVSAIRFIRALRTPRTHVTESRLVTVIGQVHELARATESSSEAKLAALRAERDRIDAEIAAVEAGKWAALPEDRAIERAREILMLSDDLVADFRRVRDEFERVHRRMREQVMESDASRGEVLDTLFSSLDDIRQTEAGRTFAAFYALLTDSERSAELDAAVEEVLQRDFMHKLTARDRSVLRNLTSTLLHHAMEVHEVLQGFARSLRDFVRSTELREIRRLNDLIKKAERAALAIKDQVRPTSKIGVELNLTSAEIHSASEGKLYDHTLAYIGGAMVADDGVVSMSSMRELFAHGEIDFASLKHHVAEVLKARKRASISDVLAVYPARQGLGSIVGLLWIADREGVVKSDETQEVSWVGVDGKARAGIIPAAYFVKEEDDADAT